MTAVRVDVGRLAEYRHPAAGHVLPQLWPHNEARFSTDGGHRDYESPRAVRVGSFRRDKKSSSVLGDRNEASQVRMSAVSVGVCR